MKTDRAFVLIDMIIAALILTSAIAATMYLFRIGFKELMKTRTVNEVVSRIPQAYSYLKTIKFRKNPKGNKKLGEDILLKWNATLIDKGKIVNKSLFGSSTLPYEFYLYKVDFSISYKKYTKYFSTDIMQYKFIGQPFNTNTMMMGF